MKAIILNYQPIDGFFDLRNFNLTKKEFQSCWNAQRYLSRQRDFFSKNPKAKEDNKTTWEKAKHLSAELQMFLFSKLKEGAS